MLATNIWQDTLATLGEFGLIDRFSQAFLQHLPAGVVGIGDDAAALPWHEEKRLLVTTDMLVEDVHFLRDKITARDLGYKALAVNLSDIAAMGGRPRSAFLSLAAPGDVAVQWFDDFFAGFAELGEATGTRLLGGDLTKSPAGLIINVQVLGEAAAPHIKYRSTAQVGDLVCVTGYLGDSGGGLRLLLEDRPLDDEDARYLWRQHNRPRPHLAEGEWLSRQSGVHAMMDVSDGIDSDLHRIMEQSRCGAMVELEQLPVSDPLRRAARRYGWPLTEIAASDGEDYCLLLTVEADFFATIAQQFEQQFQRPLFRIGQIAPAQTGLAYYRDGQPVKLGKRGFDHFKQQNEQLVDDR